MSERDLAYLAGFVEADGSMGVYRMVCNRYGRIVSYQPRLTISQKDPQILHWAKEVIGAGSVHKRGKTNTNNIMHNYVLTGKKAKEVVADMFPYFRIKQRAAIKLMLGI